MTAESPPTNFDFDISLNICLTLAKINKQNPRELAEKIKKLLLSNIKDIDNIEIAGPGFLNIQLSNKAVKFLLIKFMKLINRTAHR